MLTGTNIKKDIMLAAEIAGLKLLRATKINLSDIEPGVVLLGAIPDDAQDRMQRFIVAWATTNGMKIPSEFEISSDVKDYLPEVIQFEGPFDEICKHNGIKEDYLPFVAATAAMKLVSAGQKTKLLDPLAGFCITSYHIIAGSKTVPNHVEDKG